MWEQVQRVIVEIARLLCGSLKVGGKNLKNVRWNDMVKAGVRRKKAAWREVLADSNE